MRAAIYARYSSENQREASIEDQVRLCKVRIKREAWALTTTYTDRAVSGAQLLRAGYQNLLQDVRAGRIDVVVAEALDRISRDQEHVAAFYKQLTFAGVKLITIAEGEVNELHVGMKGTMNALFLKDLAAKTHRGLRGRVAEGRSGGGLCFGYDVVTGVNAKGEADRGARKINAEESAIVRRIFSAFAGGKSPRHIAIALNAEGVLGPAGGEWGPSTINGNSSRGTGILNNELYIGRLVWNRLRYVKDPSSGRRVSRLNDPTQWVIQDVPELQIVPRELWDRVKARQATTKYGERAEHGVAKPFWDRRRPRFLLSGLAKCGKCGSSYVKATATMFGCAAARDRGTCDNHRHIRIDDLENTVLTGLGQRLLEPGLFKVFCDEFHRELNKSRMEDGAAMQVQSRELDKISRRIRKIVDIITDDDAPVKTLKDELRELEARHERIESTLATAKSPEPLIHPNLAEVYRRKVESLRSAIAEPANRDGAFELIRSLIEAVVVVPVGKELELEIKGDLAGILHLCEAGRKAKPGTVSSAGLAEQLKMVAGAGFEPKTFRL